MTKRSVAKFFFLLALVGSVPSGLFIAAVVAEQSLDESKVVANAIINDPGKILYFPAATLKFSNVTQAEYTTYRYPVRDVFIMLAKDNVLHVSIGHLAHQPGPLDKIRDRDNVAGQCALDFPGFRLVCDVNHFNLGFQGNGHPMKDKGQLLVRSASFNGHLNDFIFTSVPKKDDRFDAYSP